MGKKKKAKSQKKKPTKVKPKIRIAQRRNEYLQYIEQIAKATDILTAFRMIPKTERNIIASMRIRPLQIEAEPGHKILPGLLTIARKYIAAAAKDTVFATLPDGTDISLHDYITIVLSFYAYLKIYLEDESRVVTEIKQGFAPFIKWVDATPDPDDKIRELGNDVCLHCNRIHRFYFWFRNNSFTKETFLPSFALGLSLNRTDPEKIEIFLDGKKRPAYRVGWAFPDDGVIWATIKAGKLGINTSFSNMPLNVYIQSHALIRLIQRIDYVGESIPHFFLFDSLIDLHTVQMEDGSSLIEYRLFRQKVGYLVFDIVEGMVIIRTFLFLTNSGTPEGENLKKISGLKTIDLKYLEIDKLSTFISSDLKDNPELVDIFTKAGCGSLFQLSNIGLAVKAKVKQAKKLVDYLRLHEDFDD